MVIRLRIYHAEEANHAEADKVFYDYVKPVHEKYGAIFNGRFRDKNGKVVVMWQYKNEEELDRIQQEVASDRESLKNKKIRLEKGLHGHAFDELILTSTGD